MITRFIIYGFVGWIFEIVFTGTGSLLRGVLSLTGYTYLWMFPIYGMALFLEPVHDRIRSAPWPIRGIIWVSLIFFIEYVSGWLLSNIIGFCPWDYTGFSPYVVDGFIRLDFFPFWFTAGLIFEKIHGFLDSINIHDLSTAALKPEPNFNHNRKKRSLELPRLQKRKVIE
ncbi:protoporphyrinogen ix oxidase, putative form, hemj [hydrocarbon metagenome]|uniref:Protoporphyrinogen ix oxidase, putative form, hemj n=1 Tax=hydrocarbon metagenome TaxID=938273 RepID=A0A0W8E1X3_9ZZZZ